MESSHPDDDRQWLPGQDPKQSDLIPAAEVISTHGMAFYEKMLAYGCHHTDQGGNPFWTWEEHDRLAGLIEIEERS